MSSESKNDQPEQPAEAVQAAEECPELHLATEAVRLAKIELEKAQKFYDDVCCQAAEKFAEVRQTTVGEAIDCTLETVKKYPGPSLVVSAAMGFCLGRLFQKLFKR